MKNTVCSWIAQVTSDSVVVEELNLFKEWGNGFYCSITFRMVNCMRLLSINCVVPSAEGIIDT